jgi:hypothetical protein
MASKVEEEQTGLQARMRDKMTTKGENEVLSEGFLGVFLEGDPSAAS